MSDTLIPVPQDWASRAFIDKAKYDAMYKQSVEDPQGFWREQAKRRRRAEQDGVAVMLGQDGPGPAADGRDGQHQGRPMPDHGKRLPRVELGRPCPGRGVDHDRTWRQPGRQ